MLIMIKKSTIILKLDIYYTCDECEWACELVYVDKYINMTKISHKVSHT